MDTVLNKMNLVEEGTKSATRLGELAAELDAQLTRVGARLQFIEKLEGRINNLHVVTADVDRKLGEQLARRTELETLKSLCDTVGTQVVDAQQKLDSVAALQHKLVPLASEVDRLERAVDADAAAGEVDPARRGGRHRSAHAPDRAGRAEPRAGGRSRRARSSRCRA